MATHDNIKRINAEFRALMRRFGWDPDGIERNTQGWYGQAPIAMSQDEWKVIVTKVFDTFLCTLLKEIDQKSGIIYSEKLAGPPVPESLKKENSMDADEVAAAKELLNNHSPDILALSQRIPPHYLESILPIVFMLMLLRYYKAPLLHKQMPSFHEFYIRYGRLVLND